MGAASIVVLAIVWLQGRGSITKGPAPDVEGGSSQHSSAIRTTNWISLGLLALKAAIGLSCLLVIIFEPVDQGCHYYIFMYVPPFLWLVLVRPPDETSSDVSAGRFALCIIAAFTYLYAYPVAGDQFIFAIVPTSIVSILLLRDGTQGLAKLLFAKMPKWKAVRMAPAMHLCSSLHCSFARLVVHTERTQTAYPWYTWSRTNPGLPWAGGPVQLDEKQRRFLW